MSRSELPLLKVAFVLPVDAGADALFHEHCGGHRVIMGNVIYGISS
jgi:hypothetical protein